MEQTDKCFNPYENAWPTNPHPFDLSKSIGKCGECNRKLYQADMYCCMNPKCPIQPKVTC